MIKKFALTLGLLGAMGMVASVQAATTQDTITTTGHTVQHVQQPVVGGVKNAKVVHFRPNRHCVKRCVWRGNTRHCHRVCHHRRW